MDGRRTVIRDESNKQIFLQTSWVEKSDMRTLQVTCAYDNEDEIVIRSTHNIHPIVLHREELTGLVEMLLTLSTKLGGEETIVFGTDGNEVL